MGCIDRESVAAGGSLPVCGEGFLASEQVQVYLHSSPQLLTVVTADTTGRANATVTIPTNVSVGVHELELRGVTSGRSLRSAPFTVTAAPSTTDSDSTLPRTGARLVDIAQAALLVLGVGLLLRGRSLTDRTD